MKRYRAAADMLRIARGPSGGGVGYAPWTRSAHQLDELDWGILQQAVRPATIDEHVARITPLAPPTVGDLRPRLTRLVAQGLLIDVEELSVVRVAESAPARITRLGIPSRGRPAALERCVSDWIDMSERHQRELEVVVADDGRDAEEIDPNRAVLEALAKKHGTTIFHGTAADRAAYARALAEEASVDRELVDWALHQVQPELTGEGTARNALLLDAIDGAVLFVDDDTRCRFGAVEGGQNELAVGAGNPFEMWFGDPGEVPTDLYAAADIDPREMFETVLGRDLGELVGKFDTTFDRAPTRICRNLRDFGGRVAAVQCGLAGDVATGSLGHYLLLPSPSRERLHQSLARYEHALNSRQGVTSVTRWTVADIDHCMTYLLALDTRQMMPPFLPVGRNCDGLFGVVFRRAARDAYMAWAPWVIEHAAAPRPSSRQMMIDTAPHTYGNDMIGRLIQAAPLEPQATTTEDGLRCVGRALVALAAGSSEDFTELVWTHMVQSRAGDVAFMEAALRASGGGPSWWRRDLDAVIENFRHTLCTPSVAHPHDLTRHYGHERALATLQQQTRRYGELLLAWPELWAAAQVLARNDVRSARRL